MLNLIVLSRIFSFPLLALITITPSAVLALTVVAHLIVPGLVGFIAMIMGWTLTAGWGSRSRSTADDFVQTYKLIREFSFDAAQSGSRKQHNKNTKQIMFKR